MLWTLGALFLLVVFLVGNCSGYDSRRHVGDAIAASEPLKAAVANYRKANGRWPNAAEAAAFPASIARGSNAQLTWDGEKLLLSMLDSPYAGRRFAYVPQLDGTSLEWKCQRIDLDPKYLPASCR